MSDARNPENQRIILTAIGNPNVDVIIELENDSLIKKYNLQYDRTTTVEEDFLEKIEKDFKKLNPKIQCIPGGCAQNTLRIFQWLMKSKFNSCMIGSVGQDEEGQFLKTELEKNGVSTSYTLKEDFKTGFIFLLILKNKVAAVYGAECLASWKYNVTDFLADHRASEAIKDSKIVLLEGFFIMHCDKVGRHVLEMCSELGVTSSFNICGDYVADSEKCLPFIKSCNIVIGNESEFRAVCRLLEISTDDFEKSLEDVFDIMMRGISQNGVGYKIKSMDRYKKILIVTAGSGMVYCLSGSNEPSRYQVPAVDRELEKDAIGAGDSFLAGFFYGLIHDFPIKKCIKIASMVGAEIVKQRGCVVPHNISPDLASLVLLSKNAMVFSCWLSICKLCLSMTDLSDTKKLKSTVGIPKATSNGELRSMTGLTNGSVICALVKVIQSS